MDLRRLAGRCLRIALPCLALANLSACHSPDVPPPAGHSSDSNNVPLPTGRSIGSSDHSVGVGSMPINVILSPDGKYAITTGNGFRDFLCSVSVADGTKAGEIEFAKSPQNKSNGLYYGLAFGPDHRLYAAEGAAHKIAVVTIDDRGALHLDHEIDTGSGTFPAGIAIDDHNRIFVANNDPTSKLRFHASASVLVFDADTGKRIGEFTFGDDGLSNFPLAIAVNRGGSRVYVGSERDDCVYVIDTSDTAHLALHNKLSTGSHPVALLLNKSQSTLFVANAQSDTISVVNTADDRIAATVLLRPQVAADLAGATPTGLALSDDEKTLYATLGDMNALAVIDAAAPDSPKLEGYVPVGWYPTSVTAAGNQLFVTNAKGDRARVPRDLSSTTRSVLYLFEGTLWRLHVPGADALADSTKKCLEDCRLLPNDLTASNPLDRLSLQSGNIKHVIYIIKENRAYDQVLGDLPQGNGDIKRCLFPRDITPNLHALAERFILLDNFYDSGEVSGDGWTWSTQAQANEYTIRNVPYQYSSRGRVFDYEGMNNDYPTGGFPGQGPDGKPLSDDPRYTQGAKPVPDVAGSPGGHLWDMARRHGLSYRNYGFFMTFGVKGPAGVVTPDNYPAAVGVQPGGHDLHGITDIDFRRFDLEYPDSDAPARFARDSNDAKSLWPELSFGKYGSTCRFAEWKREFDEMLAKDRSGGAVPALMTVRMGNDHTVGAASGRPTPRGMVADNDYAVGELVEAVSHSPIWPNCAIVIIEDDASNGPDHVDAHRSTCYVISPWIKRGTVDHSFQNTVSAVKTIESLLNLPPMCQYDAAAGVLPGWDDAPRNIEPYTAIAPQEKIVMEPNPPGERQTAPASPELRQGASAAPPLNSAADLARVSNQLDFTKADQAPADLLNEIIWKSIRGVDSKLPPSPHVISEGGQRSAGDDD